MAKKLGLNQWSEKVMNFPDDELEALKQAIEYEMQYNRNMNVAQSKVNIKTGANCIITDGKNFNLEITEDKLNKKCVDIWRNPSIFTKEPDTYSDFINKLTILVDKNKKINFVDYVSKLL